MAGAFSSDMLRSGIASSGALPTRYGTTLFDEDFSTQGSITANVRANPKLGEIRSRAIAKGDPRRVFGSDLGNNQSHLNITIGDILFMVRKPMRESGFEHLLENKPFVMAALNGMYIANAHDMTNERFASHLKAVGVAGSSFYYGRDNENLGESVTTRYRDSGSLYLRSRDEFYPGDPIRILWHSIDPAEREAEIAELPHNANHPQGRLEPILARVRYEDAAYVMHEAITDSLDQKNARARDISAVFDPDLLDRLSEKERYSVYMRADALTKAFWGIASAYQFGLIDIVTPEPDGSRLKATYGDFSDVERRSMTSVSLGHVKIERDADGRVTESFVDGSRVTDEMREARSKKLERVAAKLGLYYDAHDGSRGVLRPCHNLVESIVVRSYYPFIADERSRNAADVSLVFTSSTSIPTTQGATRMETVYALNTVAGQVGHMQQFAPGGLFMTYCRAKSRLDDSIFAKSLGHAIGGEKVLSLWGC